MRISKISKILAGAGFFAVGVLVYRSTTCNLFNNGSIMSSSPATFFSAKKTSSFSLADVTPSPQNPLSGIQAETPFPDTIRLRELTDLSKIDVWKKRTSGHLKVSATYDNSFSVSWGGNDYPRLEIPVIPFNLCEGDVIVMDVFIQADYFYEGGKALWIEWGEKPSVVSGDAWISKNRDKVFGQWVLDFVEGSGVASATFDKKGKAWWISYPYGIPIGPLNTTLKLISTNGCNVVNSLNFKVPSAEGLDLNINLKLEREAKTTP